MTVTFDASRRLDANPIDSDGAECRAILVARNEGTRLPWVLNYHRSLGIKRFFIVDNGSDDNSLEFLSQQKDCHVFSTTDSFGAANFGVEWQQKILEQYSGNHWWLIIDADEMLVYPSSETVKLPDFCRYLDSVGAEGLYTAFLDMYSRGPVAQAVYTPGQPFTNVCACFDTEYEFRPRPKAPLAADPFPPLEPIGGPRLRRFYPEYYQKGPGAVTRTKIIRRVRDALRRAGIKLNLDCTVPPILFKVPLLKGRKGLRLVNSHMVEPLRLAPVTGVLLHFKFFSDFHARAVREAQRGEHFDGGSEYGRYLKIMELEPNMSFYHAKSAIFENTAQLVKLGLIRDDASFVAFRSVTA